MEIDTSNMCSHLKRKFFEADGSYHKIWLALQTDNELTAIVRSRQLHIYRNGKKVLILAGKAAPKVLMEDRLATLIGSRTKRDISLDDVIPQNVVCSQELRAFLVEHKEIKPQFEYNQYIRDFFADDKGATLNDAIRCWHWKKIQPGAHRYETTDKDILR